ncbi:unnamed protein product, partial [Leptosia nina]
NQWQPKMSCEAHLAKNNTHRLRSKTGSTGRPVLNEPHWSPDVSQRQGRQATVRLRSTAHGARRLHGSAAGGGPRGGARSSRSASLGPVASARLIVTARCLIVTEWLVNCSLELTVVGCDPNSAVLQWSGACGRAGGGAARPRRFADPMRARTRRNAPLLLALALAAALAAALPCAAGAGVFELQILEFSNYRLQLASGRCCGGAESPPPPSACSRPCRTRFALCLKEYQSAAAPGACSFGRASSPVLGTDSFTLADPLYTLALPFSFRWTRSFTLILQAYDDYEYGTGVEGSETEEGGESGLIEEAWWSGIVEPGAEWHALRHAGRGAAVAYRVRVLCKANYYNTTCTTFCRPRDDKFGHYSCSAQGDKRCLPGWQGDNCEKPVCKEGCHPAHGRCDQPGECLCRPGWRGDLCAQCQPYPGCKHGYCNGSSWDCTCDTNWGGILCDQDLNYCGTHEPCQHGGTCENTAPDQYLCTCAEGFSGVDCERVDNPCAPQPCAHGVCELSGAPSGFTCACERGWTGTRCDLDADDCASAPCLHGGVCRDRLDAFQCDCTSGWRGPTCAEDVDECAEVTAGPEGAVGPCVNAAACNNTAGGYSCTCLAGWTGRDCEQNVDDCTGQCLNGATCIDLVDDFHCACAAGWAGRTCARDVDDCASRPCRNGGECVDLLDAYRCICPVGFSGLDCEDDRDHCAGSPCGNGAPCYTAQSDYYCHCSPGWTGKNCTQRAARDPALSIINECVPNPCQNNGTCTSGPTGFSCACRDGWTGETCSVLEPPRCETHCANGGTCARLPAQASSAPLSRCVCAPGWAGASCDQSITPPPQLPPAPAVSAVAAVSEAGCSCQHGGTCVSVEGVWACACRGGWGGPRCERAADGCASNPCRRGARCVGGAGWWACECAPGWAGPDCSTPLCDPPCPTPAICAPAASAARCVCPSPPARLARRCLELIAGLGEESGEVTEVVEGGLETLGAGVGGTAGSVGECGADNGTWWWGCNACRCVSGAPACTRLWCGLPDCLASPGQTAPPCRADEVCVPAAPALCLRPPCAPLGECRRVAGRRVEPPALPAPSSCWPGARGPPPPGCARAELRLARERLARGAHVERACSALRRALAAALADRMPPAPPLTLLCDLAPDDDDALDLAIWAGEEESREAPSDEENSAVSSAIRALSELVSRRRLAHHALLGAALRLRLHPHAQPATPPAAQPAAAPPASSSTANSGALLALAATAPLLLLGAAVAAFLLIRRRRTAAAAAEERSRRHDEEKSNNLQNEENLRRYANPLGGTTGTVAGRETDSLPRAHSLYKAQNADARNNTPPRDKELTKRALPPHPHPHPPPERLTSCILSGWFSFRRKGLLPGFTASPAPHKNGGLVHVSVCCRAMSGGACVSVRRAHAAALFACGVLLLLLLAARAPPPPVPRPAPASAPITQSDVNTTSTRPRVRPPDNITRTTPPPPPHSSQRTATGPHIQLVSDLYEAGHERPHPELCPALGAHIKVLIMVTSAPNHTRARDAVRLTWGHYAARRDIAFAFVLGRAPESLRAALDAEDALYGDLVVGRSLDSYSNLTLKTVSLLEWADTYCPRVPHLLKTDDDMFINVPRLLRFAAARANATNTIWGKVIKKSLPKRTTKSKYYVSPAQFPGKVFPEFATGPAYLVTRDTARKLLAAAPKAPYLRLEDVFLTGVLSAKLGVRRVHAPEFYNKKVAAHPCAVQRAISIHMVQFHEQFDLWRKLLDGKTKCAG